MHNVGSFLDVQVLSRARVGDLKLQTSKHPFNGYALHPQYLGIPS